MTAVREVVDLRGALGRGPGTAELHDLLQELLGGRAPADWTVALRQLKKRVFRLEFSAGAPWRSVVLKRLDPGVARRTRLVAERWLPDLGLGDRCARLLGGAADPRGEAVWHVYEDVGDETLAVSPEPERVEAAVDLIATLHTRAARHPVLPDVRRYCGDLGMAYFTANVRDAVDALNVLEASGIDAPPEHAPVPARLRERLRALLADAPRRGRIFADVQGPDTLLHGDLWTINVFVEGGRARLVDWDSVGVGPFSYDLSTFLMRFPTTRRPEIVERYGRMVARAGWRLPAAAQLAVLFDTAERARYANRVIWPALALVRDGAAWGFPELAEVERWFEALDANPCTLA
ncbi:MAG: phosphotransferase [Gemmatimonadales bacterium]